MSSHLSFDFTRMRSSSVGRWGASDAERKKIAPRLRDAKKEVLRIHESREQGWMSYPTDKDVGKKITSVVKQMNAFQTCLVLGIGGSDLAGRALYSALKPSKKKLVFAGANTDPDELFEIVDGLDLKNTCINIISKSGGTVEPMASFLYVLSQLEKKVGKRNVADHIVATTDPESGSLYELATKHGWAMLPIPRNIGGRFSALTAVGLFPLAFAGTDIQGIQKGAHQEFQAFQSESVEKNNACQYALLQYLAYTKRNQKIQIVMPYSAQLKEFGLWYRQIWAESLGKKVNRKKKIVNVGPTPISALGATDQHSQIQLYTEGPNDKTILFIEIEQFKNDLHVPANVFGMKELVQISGKRFRDILHAEREATSRALTASKRPNGTLFLKKITPGSIGALFMFYELATALSGELYDINAYNQPGVEAGKKAMHDILSR
ncbi:MAG: glucose-6-phosphate isomerase [bacterium]|nr:glucose-6-phosphate isomerase [bacterium]